MMHSPSSFTHPLLQLGHVMEDYWNQFTSFISLFRALFGEFDVDEIVRNTSGWLNVLFFLTYLFVAVFIMLSMFLAILAEAQSAVRDDEQRQERLSGGAFKQYGIFEDAGELLDRHVLKPIQTRLRLSIFSSGKSSNDEAECAEPTNSEMYDAIRAILQTTQVGPA